MKPVKISELVEVLEFDSDEYTNMVDLQTGSVVRLSNSLLGAVEDGDEDRLETMADWEKEEVEMAKAIIEDSGERFLHAPTLFDFDEYRHMERFIRTIEDADAVEQLWRAIKGKGAFRYFKDTANRLGLLKPWYKYREDAMREFVLEWAEAHNVSIQDDVTG